MGFEASEYVACFSDAGFGGEIACEAVSCTALSGGFAESVEFLGCADPVVGWETTDVDFTAVGNESLLGA